MKKNLSTDRRYRMNVMFHKWKADPGLTMDAIEAFGFSGVVTNVPQKDGFVRSESNRQTFAALTAELRARGLEYWIYDENGYPSGQAGGITLEGNEALAAKGLYMRKFEAFLQPLSFTYTIDGGSDEIFYAARYKQDLSDTCEAQILYDTAEPVPFTGKRVRVELNQGEVFYIFIVRDAYEGAHAVHNISSRKKYINLLSEAAVDRFLDVAYRPVAAIGNAMETCTAVFTDEPSLMTAYARRKETFNYALLPFEPTLFESFAQTYGYRAEPYLPLLFESTDSRCRRIRIDFYRLVGERIAAVYVRKLNDFCREHGTVLSGHYLGEEYVTEHVLHYGDYVRVLTETGYPGMDILQCTPQHFFWNAPKFLQMIARKKDTDGFMVEYCPFFNAEEFEENRFENTVGTIGILYMYGARKINTYYMPDLAGYDERLAAHPGRMTMEQARFLNEYVARIATFLAGRRPVADTYVYYAAEDVQAKCVPFNSGRYLSDRELTSLDDSLTELSETLLPAGLEYAFADERDLQAGLTAGRIIVPATDFISDETLAYLERSGRESDIVFLNRRPTAVSGRTSGVGRILTCDELRREMLAERCAAGGEAMPERLYCQRYSGGITYLYNNNLTPVSFAANRRYVIYDPAKDEETVVAAGARISVDSYRVMLLIAAEE